MGALLVRALLICGLVFFLQKPVWAIDPVGFEYSCLQFEHCMMGAHYDIPNPKCSTPYGHRGLLTTHPTFKPSPNKSPAYITECFDLLLPEIVGPIQTVCTTGSSALDKKLFCPGNERDHPDCDKLGLLQNKYASLDPRYVVQDDFRYTLEKSQVWHDAIRNNPDVPEYGIYYFENNTFVRKPPQPIQTDDRKMMIPEKIEWQSYTKNAFSRRFLIWTEADPISQQGAIEDGGQKQTTLTFGGSCQGAMWDPEGIVYDVRTGIPLEDAQLAIRFSTTETGNFEQATAGIGQILPPGTGNPLYSGTGGYYQFYGAEGYYTISPSHPQYTHFTEGSAPLSYSVSSLYTPSYNYYANSKPFFEKAGTRQIKNIPLILNEGQQAPAFQFAVQEVSVTAPNVRILQMSGRTNGPATALISQCKQVSGVTSCRNEKRYAPGNGGPAPATYFRFSFSVNQTELEPGESFELSFEPVVPGLN